MTIVTRLAERLAAIDVTREPGKMAKGAALLEQLRENEQRRVRLEAQAREFLAGESASRDEGSKSLADWAEEVLRERGGPMHYRDIAEEIRDRGFQHSHKPRNENQIWDSVWSAMYEDSRQRFKKVGRGIWDLGAR